MAHHWWGQGLLVDHVSFAVIFLLIERLAIETRASLLPIVYWRLQFVAQFVAFEHRLAQYKAALFRFSIFTEPFLVGQSGDGGKAC